MPAEKEREALRASRGLRPLTDAEEGSGRSRLPGGVFGFTYTPILGDFPLFGTARYHTFEVHILADGSVWFVGFVPPETADQIEAGREPAKLSLFSDPSAETPYMISIPMSRIARLKEYSTREKGALEMEVRAAGG
jgi:hypothetical protein